MTTPVRVSLSCALAVVSLAAPLHAQHYTIPFLANRPEAALIEFEGAECDAERGGRTLRCRFQQVFLTTENAPPDTCMVTTNAYDRVFRKETDARWVSTTGPEGACAVMDIATLEDRGGVRWTLTLKKVATRKGASADCRQTDDTEILSWQDLHRPLSCRYVQPGGLRR
jgi:hypothetical protein